ncbi:hypothetical protein OSTOST_20337, partial [Ostertagia ostertagi]
CIKVEHTVLTTTYRLFLFVPPARVLPHESYRMFRLAVALVAALFVYEVACQTVGGNRNNGTGNSTTNGTGGRNQTGGRNRTDGGDEGIYYISADLVSGVLYQVVSVLIGLIYALGGFGYGEEFGGNSTNSSNLTGPY